MGVGVGFGGVGVVRVGWGGGGYSSGGGVCWVSFFGEMGYFLCGELVWGMVLWGSSFGGGGL